MKDYIKTEDIEGFIKEPKAKSMLKDMLPKKECRFFVNKLLRQYPDFLQEKKEIKPSKVFQEIEFDEEA